MKKSLLMLLAVVLILSSSLLAWAADGDYTPAREYFEGIGANVEYLAATHSVVITLDSTTVSFAIGASTVQVNGEAVQLSAPVSLVNGRTQLPTDFVRRFGAIPTVPQPEFNVITQEYGTVKVHAFLSNNVTAVVVENNGLTLIDIIGDDPEFARLHKQFVESLGKPVEHVIISHVDDGHWNGVGELFPDVPLFSVDAAAIMATDAGAGLNITAIGDGTTQNYDGVGYEFQVDREIGAWVIKLPAQRVAFVEHLGYVNLHILLPPLESRLAILQNLVSQGYSWFIPGHGLPMAGTEFIALVEAHYTGVLTAIKAADTVEEAKAVILEQFPDYFGEPLLDQLLPLFF